MNSSWLELISSLGHEAEDDFVRLGNLHCGFNATLSFHHHNTLMIPQISHKFMMFIYYKLNELLKLHSLSVQNMPAHEHHNRFYAVDVTFNAACKAATPQSFSFYSYTQYASDAMATYPATTRQNLSMRERIACSRRVSGTANKSDEMTDESE